MDDKDVIVDKIDFDRSNFDLVDKDVIVDKIDFDRSGRNSRGWGCDCSCSCNKGRTLT